MLQIVLLRGINVGGSTSLPMADLRLLLSELGLGEARTLLQSGNVVLDSSAAGQELEALVEGGIERRFGRRFDVITRTASEWADVVAGNPFPDADPAQLLVTFLKAAPGARRGRGDRRRSARW